jgi:hypothetical protein
MIHVLLPHAITFDAVKSVPQSVKRVRHVLFALTGLPLVLLLRIVPAASSAD